MGTTKTVLIVDDNTDAADLAAEVLRLYGLDVNVAYGGLEALAIAKETCPSVIFLDLGMPVMDGFQVAKILRSDDSYNNVKIVALTAWGDMATRAKTQAAGFDLHITKPANFSTLVEIAK